MSNEPILLTKKYKDHTIQNVVDDLRVDSLPFNAYSVHTQPIRNLDITIQVLDEETETVIETVSGRSSGGSMRVESSSLIRRSGSLEVAFDPEFFPSPKSLVWFGNIFRVYVGIQDLSMENHTVNFLLGTFWIDEAALSVDNTSSTITIELSDKMTKYDEDELENMMKIPIDIPISEAIKKAMEDFGETKFGYIQKSLPNEVVPYTLEFGVGSTKISIIEKLRDMYMDYTCGYNVKGEFEFYRIEVQKETAYQKPKWSFNNDILDGKDLIVDFKEGYRLKDIKNRILIIGETSEKSGITPKGEVRITDSKNPFNIDAIGERTKVITESDYVTDDQCYSRGRYEIQKTSNFQEKCSITCVPIYMMDANDIIEVVNPATSVISRYSVDDFSIDFSIDGNMNISAHKLYYTGVEYGEEFTPLVNAFMKGINEWGWLSLGEERVKDCFNIVGAGSATITIRFVEMEMGGEQASITSYATTKNQTLQIDLADFKDLDFEDESGANGRSKADYADRVLGHEMFHAVTNDYLGHDAMIEMPLWFKEGFSEFLHGGKDRFETVYKSLSQANKKKELIDLATKQLNGLFEGTSEDYVAAYLISMAIYNLCDEKQWSNLIINLRGVSNPGINFLYKLLPIGKDNDEVKAKVIAELNGMPEVWKMLFDKKDLDTGSVGGIHFMNLYGVALTAESVFNNANAKVDSIGFILKKDR